MIHVQCHRAAFNWMKTKTSRDVGKLRHVYIAVLISMLKVCYKSSLHELKIYLKFASNEIVFTILLLVSLLCELLH